MKLNYKEFGSGQPIVILHGLFGTLDNWQTIAKQLASNHTVFIVDLRNHGRSPHTDSMRYLDMAEDIRAFMEEHWLYSAAIIGHSMGGKVAMTLAFEYPDLVSRLAVIDIAPKRYSGGHENVFETLTSLNLTTLENRKQAEEYIAARIADRPTVQFLMKNLSRDEETGHFEWKMNLPVITRFYQDILSPPAINSTYAGPTLFVRGGASNYVTDTDIPDIRRHFPAMQLITVPNVGHWVHAEAPQALLRHLIDFL